MGNTAFADELIEEINLSGDDEDEDDEELDDDDLDDDDDEDDEDDDDDDEGIEPDDMPSE
jgi:ribonuclease E